MNNLINNFTTDSFILASFLLSESIRLISLDRNDPRRILFIFEESEKRKLSTEKFLSYQSFVEPHRLFSAQKDLKQLIYQKK